MNRPRLVALLIVALATGTVPALALLTMHGREPLDCSGWSPGLKALVNHPARIAGVIGPLAPSARFDYSGDTGTFKAVLAAYAGLTNQTRSLYLTTGPQLGVPGSSADVGPDFSLSITHDGTGYLILPAGGRVNLDEIRLPEGVSAELLPSVGIPTDPSARAALEAAEQKAKEILKRWQSPGE